jgi:hypothetical protein
MDTYYDKTDMAFNGHHINQSSVFNEVFSDYQSCNYELVYSISETPSPRSALDVMSIIFKHGICTRICSRLLKHMPLKGQ